MKTLQLTKSRDSINGRHRNGQIKISTQKYRPYIGSTTRRAYTGKEHTKLHFNVIRKEK